MDSDSVERTRNHYGYFLPIATRWMDNDVYGHINNVTYYSYFDTAANAYLIERGGLDIHHGAVIGLVVESHCRYHAALEFPQQLEIGVRVNTLGNRSVTYGIAIFKQGQEQAAATGYFVHVFVDREHRRPTPIPESIRTALQLLL